MKKIMMINYGLIIVLLTGSIVSLIGKNYFTTAICVFAILVTLLNLTYMIRRSSK